MADAGWLAASGGGGTTHANAMTNKAAEYIEFDVNSPKAMTEWAKGVCRNQRIGPLAAYYKVDETPEAVSRAIASDLPEGAKKIVIRVCESELKKSSSASDPF